MKQRGRRSSASLSIVPPAQLPPPKPPVELSAREAKIWRSIVSAMPPDWFLKAPQLLTQYCRHIERANSIARMIDSAGVPELGDAEGLRLYGRLLGMAQRESAVMVSLATKMRLTQQSRYSAKSAAVAVRNNAGMMPPWIR